MNESEAFRLMQEFYDTQHHTQEDEFLFVEAAEYILAVSEDEADREAAAHDLGAFYYDKKRYDLALKYYTQAYDMGDVMAAFPLGYIWYYGRTGTVDYSKAFEYFSKVKFKAEAKYKLADMYQYGRGVAKDRAKYRSILEELYEQAEGMQYLYEPLPEIYLRMAKLREEDGETEQAVDLLLTAKDFLAQRMRKDRFFGNFVRMKEIIEMLYCLTELDTDDLDFYDLYQRLKTPAEIEIIYKGNIHLLRAVQEESCAVEFEGKWYRDVGEFMEKAELDGSYLTEIYDRLMIWEVI